MRRHLWGLAVTAAAASVLAAAAVAVAGPGQQNAATAAVASAGSMATVLLTRISRAVVLGLTGSPSKGSPRPSAPKASIDLRQQPVRLPERLKNPFR
jgi:hypothetical protein